MKKIFTLGLMVFFIVILNNAFSQSSKLSEFKPEIKSGKLVPSSQNVIDGNMTSILTQMWVPNNWVDQSRVLYSYSGEMVTEVYFDSLVNGNWKTYGSIIMEYNNDNKLMREISNYYESDGTLVHGVKWEFQYSGNNMIEWTQFMWDVDQSIWESYEKTVYTYTGDLVSKLEDYNDMGDGSWELESETAFQYDGQNREIESLTRTWSSVDNEFTNSELAVKEYYKAEKMSKWESKSWDLENQQWSEENYWLFEYTYDGNDNCILEVSTISFGLMGFSYQTKSKQTSVYDANNYLIETIDYTWDEMSAQYLPVLKSEFSNSAEGLVEVIIEYSYSGGEWVKVLKHIYDYDGAVDVNIKFEIPTEIVLNQNYPNPFNPTTVISYYLTEMDDVELDVYNILGKHILNLVNKSQSSGLHEVNFDAMNLASGIYIYQLKTSTVLLSKTCILLK